MTWPLMVLQNDTQVETSQKLQKLFSRILSIRLQCFLSSPFSHVSLASLTTMTTMTTITANTTITTVSTMTTETAI